MGKFPFTLRRLVSISGAMIVLGGAGCTSSDLSKDANIASEVAEALPTDAPAPTDIARALWYPNASSFDTTDISPVGHGSGVLALAGDKLWFLSWNETEHHYDVLKSIPFLLATNISVAHMGPSTLLVVESGNLSFDSFELLNASRLSTDQPATQALYEKLRALRSK